MVRGYEVEEDGTLQEVEMDKSDLESTKVVCIVDDATKSIYLWKGSQAGIRRKFIGARVATNLRTEYGFHFKVRPLDEGEEPPTFFTALNGTTAAEPVIKPGGPPPTPKQSVETHKAPSAPPPRPPVAAETAPSKPSIDTPISTPTVPKPKPAPAAPAPRTVSTAPPASASAPVSHAVIQEMIKELEESESPEGYRRELLIVFNELYTVAEHKTTVFGQEKVKRQIEKVKDPPEGTFMAEGFVPRVIVKDGRVLGIELLKGTPDAILSPIKTEMKERLGDLISFFTNEIETETKSKADSKKKKKLVAK